MHVKCRQQNFRKSVNQLWYQCWLRFAVTSPHQHNNNVIFPGSWATSFNGLLQQCFCCNINDANYDKLSTKLTVFYTVYSQSSLQYCIIAVALYFLGEIMNILEEKSIMLWHLELELSDKSNTLYCSFKHLNVKDGSSSDRVTPIIGKLCKTRCIERESKARTQ